VSGVLAARFAKFLRFHPVGMLLPILGGRIIPVFAIVALQRYDFAHRFSILVNATFSSNFSNFAPTYIDGQDIVPSDKNEIPPVSVIYPDPKTLIACFLNIKAKSTCVRDTDSSLSQHLAAFIA
jgi:hypothetical protein